MTFTTDHKPCGCSRRPGAPKCAECAPRPRRVADSARTRHTHIHIGQILQLVRERLAGAKG